MNICTPQAELWSYGIMGYVGRLVNVMIVRLNYNFLQNGRGILIMKSRKDINFSLKIQRYISFINFYIYQLLHSLGIDQYDICSNYYENFEIAFCKYYHHCLWWVCEESK